AAPGTRGPAGSTGRPAARRPKAWAFTGAAAGLLGIASMEASMRVGANWQQTAGDPDAIVADLAGQIPTLLVFHTTTVLAALLAVVFGAGLHRRLALRAPQGSLLPGVAAAGMLL